MRVISLLLTIAALAFGFACTGPVGPVGPQGAAGKDGRDGRDGLPGKDGRDGSSCTVKDNEDGTYLLSCTDGTSITLRDGRDGQDGQDGKDGSSCAVTDNGDGTKTISCSDGTSVVVRDGVDGEDGADAAELVFRFTEEPSGDNCQLGGTKIEIGLDNNPENGLLDDAEIQNDPIYVCDGIVAPGTCQTLEGNVTVRNSLDLMLLRTGGCTRITGSLNILTTKMRAVTGLHTLTQVDGDVFISSTDLEFVSLPALQVVGGNVDITGSNKLQTVDLGALQTIANNLTLRSNPQLQTVDLRALRSVNFANIGGLGRVTQMELPALQTVTESFLVSSMPLMTAFKANALVTVDRTFYFSSNPVVDTLELNALTSVSTFDVTANPLLPQCQVERIRQQLPANITYSSFGNNISATCP